MCGLCLNCVLSHICSFDDGDFDDAEEDEGLDDLENVEDVSSFIVQLLFSLLNVTAWPHQTPVNLILFVASVFHCCPVIMSFNLHSIT